VSTLVQHTRLSKVGMVIFLVAWAGLVLLLPSIHQVGYLLTLKTREGLIYILSSGKKNKIPWHAMLINLDQTV
jgi:hypothetical protein